MPHAAQISPTERRMPECAYCYREADGYCECCAKPRCRRHDPTCAVCGEGCCVGCVREVPMDGVPEVTWQLCERCREKAEEAMPLEAA